jgi:hypothetical protein
MATPPKSTDTAKPKSTMYPRIRESPSPEAHPTEEAGRNKDAGTGDDVRKVRVTSEPEKEVRKTPPAGKWNDTFEKS